MKSEKNIKTEIGVLCSLAFLIVSYLTFRTNLPKTPTIFLYNLIIIISLQGLGFYRGLFFLGASILLTILLSLAADFHYVWNVPVFFMTFLIVDTQIKKRNYYTHITQTRIEEIRENTNLLADVYRKHQKDALSLERREQRYSSLKNVTSILSSSLSVDTITQYIIEDALKIVGKTDVALLFLVDTKKQELNLVVSKTQNDLDKIKAKQGDLLDEWVFKQRQCLLVEDIKKDFRFSEEKLTQYKRPFRSVISSPLVEERKVTGIVRLEHPKPYNYTSEDLRLLDILCDLGAASIANAKFYKQTLDLAITDGLTGLYLRRYFLEKLTQELLVSLHNNQHCAFLMIDIDNFKDYNDRFGHTAGDIVLKTIAKTLQEFRQNGIVGRYGGEEFSILLPETPKSKAEKIGDTIREAIKHKTIELRRIKTNVTVSIGLASFPEDAKLQDELILKADERLYKAKREGRDKVISD